VQAGTLVRDTVDYSLPLGRLGMLAHGLFVRRDLDRIFAFRHQAVESMLV
jgi:ligand-binding SRPBCC domain-containing protein